MFGIGKTNINSSMTTIYLFLFILVVNQFLTAHSFRLMHDDVDQNEGDDVRRALIRRLVFANFPVPEDTLHADTHFQPPVERSIQRRFCCMSPLSGRKRSVRDLVRQQVESRQA